MSTVHSTSASGCDLRKECKPLSLLGDMGGGGHGGGGGGNRGVHGEGGRVERERERTQTRTQKLHFPRIVV